MPKEFSLIGGVLLFAGAAFLGSAFLADRQPLAVFLPLALVGLGFAGWLMLAAIYGSRPAIICYLVILTFVIDAQFRVRGAGELSLDWQGVLKFLLFLGAGAIGVWHLPPLKVLLSRPASACCLAYITFAAVSTLYSPLIVYSFGGALALFCLFAFAHTLTTRLTEAQFLWTLLLTLTVFNVIGWIVYFGYPALGTSTAWTEADGFTVRMCGLAGQSTNLGAVCATTVGAAFVLWYKGHCRAWLALLLGGFALVTLIKSDARTAEIAVLIGIGVIVAARSVWLTAGGVLTGTLFVACLQIFPGLFKALGTTFSRSGNIEELYTLTGRLEIWAFTWQEITLKPFLGYGYNSSKEVIGTHLGFENGLMVDTAHNLYLQSLLSVGLLGTLPLVILFAYLVFKCCVRPIPTVCFTLAVALITSISDTDTIGGTPTLATIMLFVIAAWPGLSEFRRPASLAPRLYRSLSTS